MAFVQAMNTHATHKKGVNGADVYTADGVGDHRVTLFTMLNRGLESNDILTIIKKIRARNQPDEIRDLFVMAFQTRDVRGGKGEKNLFYDFMSCLYIFWPKKTITMLSLVPEYGCWRDMWELWRRNLSMGYDIMKIVKAQFMNDLAHVASGSMKDVSLLAKWLPREKSATYTGFAQLIAKWLFINESSPRQQIIRYRKETSFINSALKTVEINMCGGTWANITPSAVPGRCLKLHDKAFLNIKRGSKDELRAPDSDDRNSCRKHFKDYTLELTEGTKKAHGANVLMPHELSQKAMYEDMTPEQKIINQAQWDSIREETMKLGGLGKVVAMCDFSGSMEGNPIEISKALGILISECAHPSFRDHILTFDSVPTWHSFAGLTTLESKMNSIRGCGQGLSTDFYKACQMIMNRMVEYRVPTHEAPDDLIVITDMGFDDAKTERSYYRDSTPHDDTFWETIIARIRREFKEAGEALWGEGNGWKVPRIVIWNVSAKFKDFHATAKDDGVIQLSGWSPSILKVLQKGGLEVGTSYDGMRVALDDERYDAVRAAYDLA
jgi:hypothetical protein